MSIQWLRCVRDVVFLVVVAIAAQGCMTTKSQKFVAKKKPVPHRHTESYALMDDGASVDQEILKRGNKTRGLSEY